MMPITVLHGVPELPADAGAWLDSLPGPVAISTRGRDPSRTRVVSGMLHGNEPSGLRAIFDALRSRDLFATDVLFFIGAVDAARTEPRHTHRTLPGRRDLNRCFHEPEGDLDGRIAESLLELVRARLPEALVDLHNNSGHNPAYGVGMGLDAGRLGLTSLFAERYVATSLRLGSLHEVLPRDIPAVTIECGRAGDPRADEVAIAGLSAFLHAKALPRASVDTSAMRVLHDPTRVRVRDDVSLGYGERSAAPAVDLTMDLDADRHNFQRLPAGTRLGWLREGAPFPFEAMDASGSDVAHALFERRGDTIVTRRSIIPIMMTTNATIARDDCLFYVVDDAAKRRAR
ncbi:MAG: hypothetical protein JWP87_2373 [Labilithrix sp.]|nr:hypothetical protein [Labilithrix sp.]